VAYEDGDLGDFVDPLSLNIWREDGDGDWTELGSEVDTGDNTVAANVTEFTTFGLFGEPSFFQVSIDEANEPVEGETLEVEVTVNNVEPGTGERDVNLTIDGVERDSETVVLDGGQEEQITLVWDTDDNNAGEYTAEVSSGDDSDDDVVSVLEDSFFDVELTATNSPINEGETVIVEAEVTNTGDVQDSQTVTLEDFDGNEVNDEEVTLGGGDDDTVMLEWITGDGDAGEDEVTVTTEDSEDTAVIDIQETQEPFFDVEITDTNSPVTAGEELDVDITVSNLGQEEDTREVNLTDFDGNQADADQITLGGGQNDEVTLSWQTGTEDLGTGDVTVFGDNQDTGEVTVVEEGEIISCREIDEPGGYEITDEIDGDSNCIEVTANNVHLDGGGNSIAGADNAGVLVQAAENVTIDDLVVRDSGGGAAVLGASDITVHNSTFDGNAQGIFVQG